MRDITSKDLLSHLQERLRALDQPVAGRVIARDEKAGRKAEIQGLIKWLGPEKEDKPEE